MDGAFDLDSVLMHACMAMHNHALSTENKATCPPFIFLSIWLDILGTLINGHFISTMHVREHPAGEKKITFFLERTPL
jgi:hypothetical protein